MRGLVVGDQATQINYFFQHLTAPFRLEELTPNRTVDHDSLAAQPSRLLAVSNQVVPFLGREAELSNLQAWIDVPAPGLAVQLWHASGGHGKSRLAQEFSEQSFSNRWKVLNAHPRNPNAIEPSSDAERGADGSGTLLVVDYADRWQPADLWSLLASPRWYSSRTRILLLGRTAGHWWTAVAYKLRQQLNARAEAVALAPMARTASQYAHMFCAARDRFAQILEVRDPQDIDPPSFLRPDVHGQVLGIHMAALAAVYARGDSQPTPDDPSAISAYLLRREQERWHAIHVEAGRPTDPATMARAAYLSCLLRPVSYPLAVTVLASTGVAAPGERANEILHDHALSYPPADPATVLEPMYPDRLGEDFYSLLTPGHLRADFHPDPWTVSVPAMLAAASHHDSAMASILPRCLFLLIEAAQRWPHVAHKQLFPLLRERPDIAIRAGSPALAALAGLSDLDLSVIDAIAGPVVQSDPDAAPAMATLTELLVRKLLEKERNPVKRAELLHRLAAKLRDAARFAEAMEPARQAVSLLDVKVANSALLAEALGTLGDIQASLRNSFGAQSALARAIRIWRHVESTRTRRHNLLMAATARRLGALRLDIGKDLEALAAVRVAVRVWHRHVNPDAHEMAEHADALILEGKILHHLGRKSEAQKQLKHAADLMRDLTAVDPLKYGPKLAMVLHQISQSADGASPAQRVAAAGNALQVYRNLAALDATFIPHVARALTHVATLLGTESPHEALSMLDEAIRIHGPLQASNQLAHLVSYAQMMRIYARIAIASEIRLDVALQHATHSVQILKNLAGIEPATYDAEVNRSGKTVIDILRLMGRHDEAEQIRPLMGTRLSADELARRERLSTIRPIVDQLKLPRPNRPPCEWCKGSGVIPGHLIYPPGSPGAMYDSACPRCHGRML